ncbi:pyridoxal phosphate-dependent transferase [Xylariaceae sp. FL0804]|nr:pyridoxal phosphate-dependent transferase [Xylariaceae sp. FL0804]
MARRLPPGVKLGVRQAALRRRRVTTLASGSGSVGLRHRTGAEICAATTAAAPPLPLLKLRSRSPSSTATYHSTSSSNRRLSSTDAMVSYTEGSTGGPGPADAHQAPASSWIGHEGAAAFDLRSDTMTTPTLAMLSAIQTTTLLDDVFEEDPTTTSLEAHVAELTGKEAALFVVSGTMGNQVALRTLLTQPPHAVLCDHRSHIVKYEAGGVSSFSGAMLQPVVPQNGRHLTLEDVKKHAVISDNVHDCPTAVISLENTINGCVLPLAAAREIAAFARQHGLRVHCDGARLWEAAASGAGSLRDYAACFDTISLCFSKGLGAPIGSIIVGPAALVRHARRIRKMVGGGLRQSGVVAAAARVAVDVTFGTGPNGEGGLLRATHDTARRVEKLWTDLGGRMALPVETNMCWLDLGSLGCTAERFQQLGRDAGLRLGASGRIITHYQVGDEALGRLAGVFRAVAQEHADRGGS